VDDPVDNRGSDGLVSEDASPAGQREVRGEDQGGVLVLGGEELEEQGRGVLLEREMAELVDENQSVASELGELSGKPTGGGGRGAFWPAPRR